MKSYNVVFLAFIFWLALPHANAHNVKITNVDFGGESVDGVYHHTISFDCSAEGQFAFGYDFYSAFRFHAKYKNINGSNWETVWFDNSNHTMVCSEGCNATQVNETSFGATKTFDNGTGYMSVLAYRGASTWFDSMAFSVVLFIHEDMEFQRPDIKLFVDEMVFHSTGEFPSYYVGDGISENRWHQGNDTLSPFLFSNFSYDVPVGTASDEINSTLPDGVPVAAIPRECFTPQKYTMRYEITQKQYVDFLNCLSREAQNTRTSADVSGTSVTNYFVMSNKSTPFYKNGVRCDEDISTGPITFYCDLNHNGIPNENDDGTNTPMNYLSVEDYLAYLDWAGLKPMNEFNYEFLCRGSEIPIPGEFAWGSTEWNNTLMTTTNPLYGTPEESVPVVDGPVARFDFPLKATAAANDTTNRVQAGATATGLFEMTGNAAEIVHAFRFAEDFDAYPLEVGDGSLDLFGNQNNGWPINYPGVGNCPYYTKGRFSNVSESVPDPVSKRGSYWNTSYPNFIALSSLRGPANGGRGGF